MSFLATFNALGPPICDTYSHLWAFVQAMDAFYLEGCSSPLSARLDFCHQCFRFYTKCHLLHEALQGEVPLPYAVCAHVFAFFFLFTCSSHHQILDWGGLDKDGFLFIILSLGHDAVFGTWRIFVEHMSNE